MAKQTKKRSRKARILIYFYVLLILMSLFTVASYTWFSLSRTPRVSDMNMYINSQTGLELSADPGAEEWVQQLDFRDLVDVTTPLRPITWSDQQQCFYAAGYGIDGRLTGYDMWQPLNDERNANKDNLDGYYIKSTLYARSGVAMSVTLSEAVEVDEGVNGSGTYVIGTPIWDSEEIIHNNGGQGAENAVRIGIRTTPVDQNGTPIGEKSPLYIYEPNADGHNDGSSEYVQTPSMDGTEQLVDDEYLILQSASTWTEASPVQRTVVIKDLGEFVDKPTLFTLKAGEIVQIDLYIWLEGQDIDCTNEIREAQILANVQFHAETDQQSGLVPIE